MTTTFRRAVSALAFVPLLALAACAGPASADTDVADAASPEATTAGLEISTSPDQDRIHTTKAEDAIALLPAEIKKSGVLKVATTAGAAPPLGFLADDEKTPIGNETDIASLVADALGLKLELEQKAWADWPLALQSGDVDAVISNVTVTEERKELFDFSTYRNDQLGWLTSADSKIKAINGAEGHRGSQGRRRLRHQPGEDPARLEPGEHRRRARADQERFAGVLRELHRRAARRAVRAASTRTSARTPTLAYSAATAPDDFKVVGTLNGGWPLTAQIAVATAQGLRPGRRRHRRPPPRDRRRQLRRGARALGPGGRGHRKPETNPPGLPKTS